VCRHECVAVYCSVLQCVAVCCSVLQWVTVWATVEQLEEALTCVDNSVLLFFHFFFVAALQKLRQEMTQDPDREKKNWKIRAHLSSTIVIFFSLEQVNKFQQEVTR